MTEDASKKEEYAYDSYGLFLGLISYPFDKDGKKIYEDLKDFFEEHKKRLKKYDSSEESDLTEFNEYLYEPAGYRMLGSQGLAVLSIVDDYAFPIRYFDKDHIQTLFEAKKDVNGETEESRKMYFEDFHSVAVMGVTENKVGKASIINKAEGSFLKKKDRFPFIGIIRLKIKSENFLLGYDKGIKTVRLIREQIDNLSKDSGITDETPGAQSFHITMECYDNDEMTVVAFSDSLLYLFNFLGEIRSMTNCDLEKLGFPKSKNKEESHVFGSTLISFGYDVKLKEKEKKKEKVEKVEEVTFLPYNENFDELIMKCVIEPKSGHRDSLFDFLNDPKDNDVKELGIRSVVKNMTGGCNIIATMPLAKILKLEKICLNNADIKRDAKKIKVVLEDCEKGRKLSKVGMNHGGTEPVKGIGNAKDMKDLMKKVGISKPLRDSMLSLYELFSTANEDILQRTYLEELRRTLEHFYEELQQKYEDGYPISEIEKSLDAEVRNMENAIYDRLHLQKRVQAPLEYSGGIQQYLTSFNYAYSKVSSFFNIHDVYVTITGAERGSSVANLFNLNINEILYPELFITLLWKEIANFSLLFDGVPNYYNVNELSDKTKKFDRLIDIWRNLTMENGGYDTLFNEIYYSPSITDNDLTSRIVLFLLKKDNTQELLKYFFKDYLVCALLFNYDFKVMWHFYFKTLLQTSVCYEKLNQMKREHFIHMLLRLFLVAETIGKEGFIEGQKEKPFDNIVSGLWFEHYRKTWAIAKDIYNALQKYGFKEMCELHAFYTDFSLNIDETADDETVTDEVTIDDYVSSRNNAAKPIKATLEKGMLVEWVGEKFDFVNSLFYAYMKVIFDMDHPDLPIKSLPRDGEGEILSAICSGSDNEMKKKYYDNAIALLADPSGGFFVPSFANRKKYFLYRTALYRSLWNCRYNDLYNKNEGSKN